MVPIKIGLTSPFISTSPNRCTVVLGLWPFEFTLFGKKFKENIDESIEGGLNSNSVGG
jgi:hypothetical protein